MHFRSCWTFTLLLLLIDRFDSIASQPEISTEEHSWHIENYARSGLKSFRAKCMEVQDEERFDCHPDNPSSESECISRGCCWMPAHNPAHAPHCFFPKQYTGYSIYRTEHSSHMSVLYLKRMIASGFVHEVPMVKVEVIRVNTQQVRVRVYSASERRFEVPISLNVTYQDQFDDALYSFTIEEGILLIRRKETNRLLWSANLNTLIFSDQMIQINTKIATDVVYGLGEHKDDFRKALSSWKQYTFFNWDQPPAYNSPLYGVHAMYVSIERNPGHMSKPITAHSVFLLNSNAMEALLQPKKAITWRTIGGILDFFINLGPTIDEAVQQHVSLVGRPQMPPYWSLGFQLCRYDVCSFFC
jgi:alpha-glucosidase (family GH31 glycosyl hydrolase)